MTPALLVVDMQNYFFRTSPRRRALVRLVPSINGLLDAFDRQGWPVFHVMTVHKADRSTWDRRMKLRSEAVLLEDSEDARPIAGVGRSERHLQIRKTRLSAFTRTDLEARLRHMGVDQLVVCGAYTHGCVGQTAIDACERDFDVAVCRDAVYSHRGPQARATLRQLRSAFRVEVLTTDETMSWLSAAAARMPERG